MNISKKEALSVRFHNNFFKDLDNLSSRDIQIFERKREKILKNPKRQKHIVGGSHCYREPITKNIRVVYFIHKNVIWFLTIGSHNKAYSKFKQRLYQIKVKYGL